MMVSRAFAERERRCIAHKVTELAKRLDRPVVLVGLMGVGKSTVGRRLARRLGLDFVDSDTAIEELLGKTAIVARGSAGCRVRQPEVEVEYGADEGVAVGGAHGLRLRRAAASSSLSRLR